MSTTTELLAAKAELQRVTAELVALRGGVEALVERTANSSCIHLNDLYGDLRALLTMDADQ